MWGKRYLIGVAVILAVLGSGSAFAKHPIAVKVEFDVFCLIHFGAMKEPEMYKLCGDTLEVTKESTWKYVSEKSAVIGWRTSLPAKTHVEYGPKKGLYYWRTPLSDPTRNFNAHVHHLKGLSPETTFSFFRCLRSLSLVVALALSSMLPPTGSRTGVRSLIASSLLLARPLAAVRARRTEARPKLDRLTR